MRRHAAGLLALRDRFGAARLTLRVSLDHHAEGLHDAERGEGSFAKTLEGLSWLAREGFHLNVAGGLGFGQDGEAATRAGYAALFARNGIAVETQDPVAPMLFPEVHERAEVPEITEACWGTLRQSPDSVMCAPARMVVKRKGADRPAIVACTPLPHDPGFELGATLAEAARPVALNHPHCALVCVLGGAAYSR